MNCYFLRPDMFMQVQYTTPLGVDCPSLRKDSIGTNIYIYIIGWLAGSWSISETVYAHITLKEQSAVQWDR